MSTTEGVIYTAATSTKERPSTDAYARKGLNNLTAERPSIINILGKPRMHQIAYSGYKDNIEAFLYATIRNQKVLVSAEHLPLPVDYEPLAPYNYPQVVFAPAKVSTKEAAARMVEKLADEDIETIRTKQGEIYALKLPSFKTLSSILPKIAKPVALSKTNYAQVEGATTILRVYQCIDAFLATNLYYYRKEEFANAKASENTRLCSEMEFRQRTFFNRPGWDQEAKKMKYTNEEMTDGKGTRVDNMEEEDLTPQMSGFVSPAHIVTVAKPSMSDSRVNWGAPTDLPNAGGLIFPFFPDMLLPDGSYIRDVVGRRFFRNLGAENSNAKDAYKIFRANIGTIATTPQGIQLCHMLMGVDLALDTQTQLFLFFEKRTYLGFALLGEEFDIFAQGKWHAPVTADELREAAESLSAHEGVLKRIAELLSDVEIDDMKSTYTARLIDTPRKLADLLSKLKLDKSDEDEKAVMMKLGDLIGRLNYPMTYKKINPDNILWALDMLTSGEALPEDLAVYIPRSNWANIGSREYQILASFGSRSFHFRDAKGDEYTIPRSSEGLDIFATTQQEHKKDALVIFEDVTSVCFDRWRQFVTSGKLRVNYQTRALGVKAFRYTGDNLKKVWDKLKSLRERGVLGVKDKVPEIRTGSASGEVKASEIGTFSLDDLF